MGRFSRVLAIPLLLFLFVAGGCYTVLRHPTGDAIVHGESYYRSCADCHADAAYYHPYYTYGRSHYRWGGYYGYPWWYDDYWWYPHHDGDDTDVGPPVEEGTRHLWGSGGWAAGGWGFRKPTPPQEVREPARPESEAPADGSKPDETKPKEEGERHLWKEKKKGF